MNKILSLILVLFVLFHSVSSFSKNQEDPLGQVNQIVLQQTGQEIFAHEKEISQEKNGLKRLTLDEAISFALENNPALQQSLQEVLISKAEVRQARLPENPEAFGGAEFAKRDPGKPLPHYNVDQNVLDFYLAILRKRAALSQLEETKLKTATEIVEFVAKVKKAYYSVQALEQFQDQLRQILSSTETAAALSKRQLEAGNINSLELNAQNMIAEQARVESIKADTELKVAKTELAELLGHPELAFSFSVQKRLPNITNKDSSYLTLEKIAFAHRLDLAALKQKNSTLSRNYDLAKWQGFPKLTLGVASETDIEGGTRTGPDMGLQIPLFNRGQGTKEKVKAQIEQNQYAVIAMENHIRKEIKESLVRLAQSRQITLRYQQTILPLFDKTLKESLLHYNFMLKGPFDLLQMKREEIRGRREYSEALRDYWVEFAHLEQIVGGSFKGKPL